MFDKILERVGLKYEDLDKPGFTGEKEEYVRMLRSLEENKLSVPKLKDYIRSMRDHVAEALTKTKHNSKQDLFLKARLRNYMLLEAFLSTPEKAKEALEKAIAGLVPNKRA